METYGNNSKKMTKITFPTHFWHPMIDLNRSSMSKGFYGEKGKNGSEIRLHNYNYA